MNKHILSKEVQEFILNYTEAISNLAFSGSPFKEVPTPLLIQQIESRRKIIKKLPKWYNTKNIYYPPKLNLEQTSSQITAEYKASIVRGNSLADLTGGFGVDCWYFSEIFKVVHHFEHHKSLSEIAKYNFSVFNNKNITCIFGDGLQQLEKKQYDVIYVDPSRRHDNKGKVFFLTDCEPNIPINLEILLNSSNKLLVKTSPMLDISIGLKELVSVSEIHIVAVNNEVKELLWLLVKNTDNNPKIKTVNFNKDKKETFNFILNDVATTSYSSPLKFLYVPNTSIMKSGAFHLLSERFQLNKLSKHTHLYTSNNLKRFPGKIFVINKVIPYKKQAVKNYLKNKKANIAIRNFKENVSDLRKKWKIKDGGADYLFFITIENNKKVILDCSKV